MALFANSHFVNFRGYISKKNLQMCTVVRDPKTGQVFTSGNSAMALSHLQEVQKITRRASRDWVPVEMSPALPLPLSNLIGMPDQLRAYASKLLQHFLKPKQKIGQV